MASKPKSKTYIVLHNGLNERGIVTTFGRYRVGARNPKEAETLVREVVGKHAKVKVYYEDKSVKTSHGIVVRDRPSDRYL